MALGALFLFTGQELLAFKEIQPGTGSLVLTSFGRAKAVIVTPGMPSAAEKLAAERFQHYVEKIGGARLEIFAEGSTPPGPKVFIGHTKAGRSVRAKLAQRKAPS